MEGLEGVKVEEISRENIKSCIPTPIHLKELKLSLFDQTTGPLPTATLLFYPLHKTTPQKLDITHLKTSLSRTLDSFYPLAGRYTSWDTIDCNDQGVPFIVTHVNCPLSTVINFKGSRKLEWLSKLYPPTEFAIIGSGIQVAIQINIFSCGGFVLGWYHSHKPLDGISAATFLGHWAALASNRNPKLPDFDAALTAFPQYPAEKDPQIRPRMASFHQRSDATNKSLEGETLSSSGVDIVLKSFVFNKAAVADIKARAASKAVIFPSRFLALSAFIWKHLLPEDQEQQRRSGLAVTVDARPRANPPLANTCIGNLNEMATVDLADHDSDDPTELPQLVAEIHESISKVKYKISDYNGDRRGESRIANLYELIKTLVKYKDDFYFLVAWCKSSGFSDVDFGYGKPKWIIPTHERLYQFRKNAIVLVDYLDSEDDIEFEAWLFLEEKKMTMLESNEEFLNFCSPRF